jgi:hypothetical protein
MSKIMPSKIEDKNALVFKNGPNRTKSGSGKHKFSAKKKVKILLNPTNSEHTISYIV